MNWLAISIVLTATLSAGQEPTPPPVSISMWAVQATYQAHHGAYVNPNELRNPPGGHRRTPIGGANAAKQAQTPVGGSAASQSTPNTTRRPKRSSKKDHRYFDASSEPIRQAMNDLPYDHYQTLATDRHSVPVFSESRFDIDDRYAITVRPMGHQEDGRIRLDVSVELRNRNRDGRPLKALSTRLMVAPGKPVKLRGFDHYPGELIIVLVSGG